MIMNYLGLFDVIPSRALDGLTGEDLRLLINGVGDINVQTLISYTSFNDESGEAPDRCGKFTLKYGLVCRRV